MNKPFSFDETVFQLLGAELGEADAIEVLQAFLADTAGKVAMLAANSQDRALIKREAHSIKSSAATFGLNDLSGLARDLELGTETITPAKLPESIGELRQAFEATERLARTKLLNDGSAMAI